jgi:hypothetical protein
MLRFIRLAAATALTFSSSDLFAEVNMREGLWEVTTQVDFKSLPQGAPALPPATETRCITKNDVENTKSVPPGNSGCEVKDISTTSSAIQWQFQCTGMHGAGETRYAGDSYEGTVTATSEGTGLGNIVMQYSGKRIGECK